MMEQISPGLLPAMGSFGAIKSDRFEHPSSEGEQGRHQSDAPCGIAYT